jgi:hypothetical protein
MSRNQYILLGVMALVIIVAAGYAYGKATAPKPKPKGLLGVGLDLGFIKL